MNVFERFEWMKVNSYIHMYMLFIVVSRKYTKTKFKNVKRIAHTYVQPTTIEPYTVLTTIDETWANAHSSYHYIQYFYGD